MNKKQNGIILTVIGIAVIIISQSVKFNITKYEDMGMGLRNRYTAENTVLKNIVLFTGIGLLVVGGIILAKELGKNPE